MPKLITFYISDSIAGECDLDNWDEIRLDQSSDLEYNKLEREFIEAYHSGTHSRRGPGGTTRVQVRPEVGKFFVDEFIYYYGDPVGVDPEALPVRKRMRDLGEKIMRMVERRENG